MPAVLIGAIMKNGKLVAQARFIPASVTAASTVAAIGPALAMVALQMQLSEVSELASTNLALTTQVLNMIRNEQWSERHGLIVSIEKALHEAHELAAVTETVWEPLASKDADISKQLDQYDKSVADHIKNLTQLTGRKRRKYLESNAEAMVFDTNALLSSLKVRVGYQMLKAGIARSRSADDVNEAGLFDLITKELPIEVQKSLKNIRELTDSLVRELEIIAKLPGRATMPLAKSRQDAKASQATCTEFLEQIKPLADALSPPREELSAPDVVCAPEGMDLDPYLSLLQWFLEDGEHLRAIAFPASTGGVVRGIPQLIDASWDALLPGKLSEEGQTFVPSTFVAVTNRRIVTANSKTFRTSGELGDIYQIQDVKYVRPWGSHKESARPTITLNTVSSDIQWLFPETAGFEGLDDLAAVIQASASEVDDRLSAIEMLPIDSQ